MGIIRGRNRSAGSHSSAPPAVLAVPNRDRVQAGRRYHNGIGLFRKLAGTVADSTVTDSNQLPRLWAACILTAVSAAGLVWAVRTAPALAAEAVDSETEASFERVTGPFLRQNCIVCHNADLATSGIRLDQLDGTLEERRLRLWEVVQHQIDSGAMPPEGFPEPESEVRAAVTAWIEQALNVARARPTPKNGNVRRLTVSQYRNTLQSLLLLEDDLTDILPPDAVSEDGFVNNSETLEVSPLLMEAYLEIAGEALRRSIVDPDSKPSIQNFRVDLGTSINPEPLSEELILGANSMLLRNEDYLVAQPIPSKPFAFEPYRMRTKYRFNEGYRGNATVRGWRDFDSIYHAVFACMRGSRGYPKGSPYSTVPKGLLLRPAIPTDEIFRSDGTFGPKANFKISVRELPDFGRFRVTVTAAKYNDGLLLDRGESPQGPAVAQIVHLPESGSPTTVELDAAGIYQVDVHESDQNWLPEPAPVSRLLEGVVGPWPAEEGSPGRLEGDARYVDSPLGRAVSFDGDGDSMVVPWIDSMDVGDGDFTVAAWVYPDRLRRSALLGIGAFQYTQGWYLEMANNRGLLRLQTTGPDRESNGNVNSRQSVLRARDWQHIAAVVRRGKDGVTLYVNGYPVTTGTIGAKKLGNPAADLHIGRVPGAEDFRGDIRDVRIYRRALDLAEVQTLVEPGRELALPPPMEAKELTLVLGGREFSRELVQPAFMAVRLPEGSSPLAVRYDGKRPVSHVSFTRLSDDHPIARRFRAFEKRLPRVGVHLGLRRDCGSTFAPVGSPQTVSGEKLTKYIFEGAIRDFPSPDVEKNNVNYLAGVREIAVRSEYTDGRDMPRLLIRSVEFEGPLYETWPPRSHQSIFIDSDRKSDSRAYAREIVRSFGGRAFRRPLEESEEEALLGVFDRSMSAGRGFRDSVAESLQVALTSPQFLFLVESSSTPEPEAVDGSELASKLSYFLWNGPPDGVLLDLATRGHLRARLESEVDRMIDDPRFSRFADEFAYRWLSLDKFDVLESDSEQFPRLTRDVRAQLRKEPSALLQHLIRNNLPARHLIASDFVMANEAVAAYYGLGDLVESGFRFEPIRHRRPELGGLLTQAAIMAGLSDGRESNPVKRGAWLARKIIAEPPDPPPPNVPDLAADTEGLPLRERLAMHRDQPGCAQCHTKIDPWGLPLEELDAGGRLKSTLPDAGSTLPDGTEVAGLEDLKRYLVEDRIDQVAFSVLQHLMTYANGRSLTYNELNYLRQDGSNLGVGGYRMRDMVRYVATSRLFLEK